MTDFLPKHLLVTRIEDRTRKTEDMLSMFYPLSALSLVLKYMTISNGIKHPQVPHKLLSLYKRHGLSRLCYTTSHASLRYGTDMYQTICFEDLIESVIRIQRDQVASGYNT
jgi:hypothetical protein